MRRHSLTLRAKLTLWSAVVVGASLLLAGAGIAYFLHQEQIENVDSALQQDARHFFTQFRDHGSQLRWINPEELGEVLPISSQPSRFIEIIGPDGTHLFHSSNVGDALHDAPTKPHTRRIGAHDVRVGTFTEDGITLRLGHDLDAVEELTGDLLFAYAVALPFVLAAVTVGGWWLARLALIPIREIADAAEQMTAQHLDRRVAVVPLGGEIGRLATVLNAMLNRLDVSFRQAKRFSADASHELKTPLTVLRSGIEDLLHSPSLSRNDKSAVAALLEQTRTLSSITESLLLLSRADAGHLQLDLRPADICEIVTACVEDARIMADGRNLTFETELPAQAFAPVDRGRFTQILLNLLDNALKYNCEGGRVHIRVTADDSALVITVGNTGAGIPIAHVSRIFERFHRIDLTANISGHGLGLSLVRELSRAHGGDVRLARTDAEWTEFEIRLPTERESAARQG